MRQYCHPFSDVAPLWSSANIALNKQEIRITRYIRKRVTVLTLLLGKLWPPQYFNSLQEYSIAVHKCNTYLLFVIMYYIGDNVLANTWSLKKYRSIIYLLTMCNSSLNRTCLNRKFTVETPQLKEKNSVVSEASAF